uniref:Putative Hydroxyproline-rich glycoprotein family protein n=1 Tax=Davidia involucrata TaxID=16924 RepID=A0A5B7B0W7_DAVIN
MRQLPSENVLEALPLIVEPKDYSQKPNPTAESAAENAVQKPPLPSLNNDTSKGLVTPVVDVQERRKKKRRLVTRQSNYEPNSRNAPPFFRVTDAKPATWCFHPPPVYQWLVPLTYPFEGLVYKPYTRPRPPTAGFVASVYGSCGPMSLNPVIGDFLNTVDGVPASHQWVGTLPSTPPLGQIYVPPYSIPVMNPSVFSSAVEPVSPFARAWSYGWDNQLFMDFINFTIPYQNSCNMLSQKRERISCVRNSQASKERKLQGSTEISPKRVQGDPLTLFPTAPTVQDSDQHAQIHSTARRTQVIKAIPHDPRSAFESAAQIFQSLQEGWK